MNIVIITFFSLGFIVLIYTGWLGIRFFKTSRYTKDNQATKDDITSLGNSIHDDITQLTHSISDLINEIRQDRKERKDRENYDG